MNSFRFWLKFRHLSKPSCIRFQQAFWMLRAVLGSGCSRSERASVYTCMHEASEVLAAEQSGKASRRDAWGQEFGHAWIRTEVMGSSWRHPFPWGVRRTACRRVWLVRLGKGRTREERGGRQRRWWKLCKLCQQRGLYYTTVQQGPNDTCSSDRPAEHGASQPCSPRESPSSSLIGTILWWV